MILEIKQALATVVVVTIILLLALAPPFYLWLQDTGVSIDTAGETFNAHIQALVDEDWELAQSYLHDDCQITVQDVEDTFSLGGIENPDQWEDYRIFSHGDDEAFLWFDETGGIQYMTKQDGQWVINCGEPR